MIDGAFIAAVEAIYDAAPDPSLWPNALQSIADVFDDAGTVLLYLRDDGSYGTIVSPRLQAAQAEYEKHWSHRDVRSVRGVEWGYAGGVEAITDRHVVTDEEVASNPIYTQFLRPHGLGWFAGVGISPDPSIKVWISVQRAFSKQRFSEAELDTLTRLGRFAEKSLRLSVGLLDADLITLGLGDALTRIGIGVFALDSLKRVVFSNPAGERVLGDGLRLANDRLLATGSAELEGAIVAMIRSDPGDIARDPRPILIHRVKSDRPLAAYVLPVSPSLMARSQFFARTCAIVLVIDPAHHGPADPAIVRDVLGLTLGEARVASLVGAGLPPREAAQKLGITEESARTALKRVFSKVGVSRQSELAALLAKLVLR